MHCVVIARRVALACAAILLSCAAGLAATAGDNVSAFKNFVANADYKDADFYIKNRLVDPKTLDTAQIFHDVFTEKYASDVTVHARAIDSLYTYLNALKPIDFNRRLTCGYDGRSYCLLVDELFTGAPPSVIDYFVERGLDLNKTFPGMAPATLPLVLRLGTVYSVADLSHFAAEGMVLGDESYSIDELAAYRDDSVYDGSGAQRLALPDNYLSLRDQNLLDVLVIALGTGLSRGDAIQLSQHRRVLCDFIAYAAPSFTPSFDYLAYTLDRVKEFRGQAIGQQQLDGNRAYQPFPDSCVALVKGMAAAHAHLESVISRFAGAGDVGTANWLISIKKQQAPAAGAKAPLTPATAGRAAK